MFLLFWQVWARRAGFVLTNDLGEFKDHYKLRVILADKIFTSNDARSKLPNKTEITSKIIYNFLYNPVECR